jgi:hypothetical protein
MKEVRRATRYPRSPVIDVSVTRQILTDAIERNSGHCVFAESVKAACPWATKIAVDLQTIRMSDREKGLRYAYLTPRSCQTALVLFDQGHRDKLHPFRFKLSHAHIARMREGSQLHSNTQTGKRRKRKLLGGVHMPPSRAILTNAENSGRGDVPRRVGGKLPPTMNASNRREFGIRAMSVGFPVGSPEREDDK